MTEAVKDGGPAFARPISHDGTDARAEMFPAQEGMTLRDWFAGKALVSLVQKGVIDGFEPEVAARAYRFADAMLAEKAAS